MILLQPLCLWYICLRLTFNENTWQYLFLALFCVESVQHNHQLRMDVYTCPELTDMVMCYGVAGVNGRRALCMYQERFTNRNHPQNVCSLFREDGCLRPRCIGGRPLQTRTPAFEVEVLVHAMGSNQSSVLRILQEQNLHAYHLQKVQGLGPTNFAPRVRFVQWFLQRSVANPAFPEKVLFTDEACFTRDSYWDDENLPQCSSEFTRRDST